MKAFITLSILFISFLGYSQENTTTTNNYKFDYKKLNYKGFNSVYDNLKALSNNINQTTTVIRGFDEMRQGQILVDTRNLGKSFEGLELDSRPSLNLEMQRIMFTGNSINPFQDNQLILNNKKK
ncbi:hypothetical protein [Lacinutrix salivirga]